MRVLAACHVHSDWSYDGSWSLTELAAEFSRRGYEVLMVTEHDRGFSESRRLQHWEACARASSERIFVLPGIEYSDASNTVHVLVWGDVPFAGEAQPTAGMLQAVKAANGVAVLAHPRRRNAWKLFDSAWRENLIGIEIWNRKTDGWAPGRAARSLLKSTGLAPFAGMDFHDRCQFFPLTMSLDVYGAVCEESILDALRNRRFKASAFLCNLTINTAAFPFSVLHLPEFARRSLSWGRRRFGIFRKKGRDLSEPK